MIKGTLIICLVISSISVLAQSSKVYGELSSSAAMGWWIYTPGTGQGIDRTDYEPKISFEAAVLVKINRIGIGVGIGYSTLFDNFMEEFEDTRSQRSKYRIADNNVRFLTYHLLLEYALFSKTNYILSPQLKSGVFDIETIHPQKANFNQKWFVEFGVLNEINLSPKLWFTLRPFYQAMMISVKEELLPGEKHRVFSLGISLGVRYQLSK